MTCERRDNTTMSEELLELAIRTMLYPHNTPLGSTRPKSVLYIYIRRRAATLTVENGEVFVERRGRKTK